MTAALVQGSPEWLQARCGSLGASRVADAVARTKTGWGASRADLMAEIIVERLTGVPAEGFTNTAMQWGTEQEPQARAEYAFANDVDVEEVGLVRHPAIANTHASPDGLITDDGLVEIKCPKSATHLKTLRDGKVPGNYVTQIQWQLACTQRAWCDFVSFDPRMPEGLQLFVKRVPRDPTRIEELETLVEAFLAEVDFQISSLKKQYVRPFARVASQLAQSQNLISAG